MKPRTIQDEVNHLNELIQLGYPIQDQFGQKIQSFELELGPQGLALGIRPIYHKSCDLNVIKTSA